MYAPKTQENNGQFPRPQLAELDEILGDLCHTLLALVDEKGGPVDQILVDLFDAYIQSK
jgi:hypothetical protein